VKQPFRLWPRGFTGRVTLVLLFAVLVQFVAGSLLVGAGEADVQRQDLGRRIAEQLLVAERVIEASAPSDHARLLSALSTHHIEIDLVEGPAPVPVTASPVAAEIAASIRGWEPSLARQEIRLAIDDSNGLDLRRNLEGALSIGEDRWVVFRTLEPFDEWVVAVGSSLRVGAVTLIVLGTAALLVRTMSAPLRQLSDSSRLIGSSSRIAFEETRGPQELRRLARTLNEMQDRIGELIAQRTNALAAVGHDLRTPLARLRLRLSAMTDPDERAAAEGEIEEMSRMLQELLDFFDAGDSGREAEPVDLGSLCLTIGEKFSDLGGQVRYEGPDKLVLPAFYDPLRRAIENLVDNAIKYGGSAVLRLAAQPGSVEIAVSDEGPGIRAEDLDRVRLPFERLDIARGDKHPGIGLGLSIAQNAAELHGGRLELENRHPRGLVASLVLPTKRGAETLRNIGDLGRET